VLDYEVWVVHLDGGDDGRYCRSSVTESETMRGLLWVGGRRGVLVLTCVSWFGRWRGGVDDDVAYSIQWQSRRVEGLWLEA